MTLQQFLSVLRARYRMVLFILALTVAATTVVDLLLPNEYTATTDVIVNSTALDPVTGSPMLAKLLPGHIVAQAEIVLSHRVALKVVDKLGLIGMAEAKEAFMNATAGVGTLRDWLADTISSRLLVNPSREGNVISISYSAMDPNFAVTAADLFADAYIQTTLELTVDPAQNMSTWFDSQSHTLRGNLEAAQHKLSQFQRQHQVIGADVHLDIETARLNQLSSQLVMAQAQIYDAQSKLEGSQTDPKLGDNVPEVLNNPFVQTLKKNVILQEINVADLAANLGEKHPRYQRSVDELSKIRDRLKAEIKTIVSGLTTNTAVATDREVSIHRSLEAQSMRVLQMKHRRDEMMLLQRELNNAQRSYDFAMQRGTQTSLQGRLGQTNVVVLNPAALPVKPSSPKFALNISLSFALGLGLAICGVLSLEFKDRVTRSKEDLMATLSAPLLGVIPAGRFGKQRDFWFKYHSNKMYQFFVSGGFR